MTLFWVKEVDSKNFSKGPSESVSKDVQKDIISCKMTHVVTKQFVDKRKCQLHSSTTTTFATMFSSGKLHFAYLAQ
jgi:hypothetical protein